MRAIIAGMMLVIAMPAAAADQFDLVCTGKQKFSSIGRAEPVEVHYRIDLRSKTWCRDKCQSIQNIASFNDGAIILSELDQNSSTEFMDRSINRVTGEWKDIYIMLGRYGTYYNAEGKCEPADFSGFPAAKF